MVTDRQVGRLFRLMETEKTLGMAAAKAGMDEKTARKYLKAGQLVSELAAEHSWRTRNDPFKEVWSEIEVHLEINSNFEAKTLFEDLQRRYPGRFGDGQIRTLQRRIKEWRAISGPAKEVFFGQTHTPGVLGASDFTHMDKLRVTIGGTAFDHLIYHFVLTYSNWEAGTICFSESFESLSQGLQNALWRLGGVPKRHLTDGLSTAVNKADHPEEFTRRYQGLLNHYGLAGCRTNPNSPHENGDIEQRHHRFKKAVEQALLLRASMDFQTREEYARFLEKLFDQLNSGRTRRLAEEQAVLRRLPGQRLDACKKQLVKVGPGSTISVGHNIYSVASRLIGQQVEARLYMDHLEIRHGGTCVEKLPRLRGEGKHAINYRHVIDSLVRKPGAFENYRYRDDLFPTTRFRVTYDNLEKSHAASVAAKQYLNILYLAARENEAGVDDVLRLMIEQGAEISDQEVERRFRTNQLPPAVTEVHVEELDLKRYDELLEEVASC